MTAASLTETHTAVVVAVGDRVYKAKKPVRFPFVDLSTRELRRRACEREVELNRRLAPDVYLGVATLTGASDDDDDDEPVVVMRRLPDETRLAAIVAAGRSDAGDETVKVARLVAAFHAAAPTSAAVAAAAAPDAVLASALRNIDELAAVADRILDAEDVATARRLTGTYVTGRAPLLAARAALGHARDGHGDLKAEDIFCLPDGPRILDCLEFDDALRYGDVLADVAFLAMDLERLGGAPLARTFLDAYAEFSGSSWPASLEHFYVAQRALVRAKVTCLRIAQGDDDQRPDAHRLTALALRHLRAARCRLVLVGGSPGTGKSTVAQGVADRFGMTLLRSDVVRKQVYGVPPGEWRPEAYAAGLYDARHTDVTYRELLRRASLALGHGESVVIDATWLDPRRREHAADVARRRGAELVELRCVAPAAVARRRVLARALADADVSDVTPEVADRMAARAAPWPDAHEVDTDEKTPEASVAAAAVHVT
jgi:aminoglycoside phosphotransferase family enzyme/predicted kinase